jgi:DNA-binding transcriptional regulator YhcF (GntR family)
MAWRKPSKRRVDKTGRTIRQDDHHIRLYGWFLKSAAWRSLTCAERCVYLEIEARYYGSNNGAIALSVRAAASACHISPPTAAKAFKTLEARGFITCTTPGGFSRKTPHANEWRLTRAKCDVTGEAATTAFMRWKPAVVVALERGAKTDTVRCKNMLSRSEKAA